MQCGTLSKNLIAAACNKMAASGADKNIYLVNYADVDRANTKVVDNVIQELVLNDGAKLYKLITQAKATTGSSTFSRGTYYDSFDHSVTLRILSKNQPTKDFVNNLIGVRAMIIVENIEDGAYKVGADGQITPDATVATKYELYGWDSGLSLSEMPFSTEYTDGVVYTATMASPEDSKEGGLPKSVLYGGGVAATKAALDAMVAE